MKNKNNIDYVGSPDKTTFPDGDVAELTNVLNEISSTCSGARYRIAKALLGNGVFRGRGLDHIVASIDPAHWLTKQMCEFRDQGNTIIAKHEDKAVGMIGYEKHHTAPDGRHIFELRRTTVLESYRGQGIGRILRERMIENLQEMDANAVLLSRIHKDNTHMQNLASSNHFTLMTGDEMQKLGFTKEWIEQNEYYGYEFYILDPCTEN